MPPLPVESVEISQGLANQVTQHKAQVISLTNMAANNPVETLVGVVITALLIFAGKFVMGLFDYRGRMAETSNRATSDAFDIQTRLISNMQISIDRNKAQFQDALEASETALLKEMSNQKEKFNDIVDRLRKQRDSLDLEVRKLTERIAKYEAQEKVFKTVINEWQNQYRALDKEHDRVAAQLEVYKKLNKG